MSWLQDRELRDHKLGDARSGNARAVDVSTAIGRMQEKARGVFPHIEGQDVDSFVRDYIDPLSLVPAKPGG